MKDLIVACPSCKARNRKALGKLTDRAHCAKCQAALPRGGGPLEVSGADFDLAIRSAQVPVLVDFWAAWCAPCRTFGPIVERYAAGHQDDVLVLKVDTEADPGIAGRFDITGIPTSILFKGGREAARQSGAMPAPVLDQWMQGALRS